MKSLPALLNAHEVRAIRAGTQTQLRRIIKPQPDPFAGGVHPGNVAKYPAPYIDAYCSGPKTPANPRGMGREWRWWTQDNRQGPHIGACPYGVPGDRLWGRETWSGREYARRDVRVRYAADNAWAKVDSLKIPAGYRLPQACRRGDGWAPSVHMPRWASRIDLEITDIRVQRLQDINEADARAEGVIRENLPPDPDNFHPPGSYGYVPGHLPFPQGRIYVTAKEAYQDLWESIYGAGSWALNPWLWRLIFRCISAAQTECVK